MPRTSPWRVCLLGLCVIAPSPSARAIVYVNRLVQSDPASAVDRTISSNTAWTSASDPYIIEKKVTVSSGVTLTVQPGVAVQTVAEQGIYVNGTLNAEGTALSPILFTLSGSGHWKGIYLSSTADLTQLSHCTIHYAGSATGLGTYHSALRAAALFIDGCSPSVTACTISNSDTDGIELWASNAIIQNNQFNTNDNYSVVLSSPDCSPNFLDNSVSADLLGPHGVRVPADTLYNNARWRVPGAGIPYHTTGDFHISPAGHLTIDAGNTILMGGADAIVAEGTLTADGTAAAPILFTAQPPLLGRNQPGDWKGIYLGGASSASVLDNCRISYAGDAAGMNYAFALGQAAVFVQGSDPSITNCTVDHSESGGIEVVDGAPKIQGCAFEGVPATWYAVLVDGDGTLPNVSGNSATGEGFLGIGLPAGNVSTRGTLKRGGTDFPYAMRGGLTVDFQQTLSIDPGVTILATGGAGFNVIGTLNAIGTAANRIRFSSRAASPAPGDFGGFAFGASSGASDLQYCDIEYAGGTYAVDLFNCDMTISQCAFRNALGGGITMFSSQPDILNNTFENLGATAYAVCYETADCFPAISGNSGSGTGRHGVQLKDPTLDTTGTYPVPGPSFPYYVAQDTTIANAATITLAAGNSVRFGAGVRLTVNGSLLVNGTPASPVQFTAMSVLPAPGAWDGILISGSPASDINNLDIRYAGSVLGSGGPSAVRVVSCSPDFDGVTFRHSLGDAIRLNNSHSAVAACTFENVASPYYAVYLEDPGSQPMANNNQASGTGNLGIGVAPGGLPALSLATWTKAGANFPWILRGDVTVPAGASLTIDEGASVASQGGGLYVQGTLNAIGTAANRITFRSAKPSPAAGDWSGIYISPTATVSALAFLEIAHAGSDAGLGTYHGAPRSAALYVDDRNPLIENIRIRQSRHNGLELYSSASIVRSSLFDGNQDSGIAASGGSTCSLTNNTLAGNGTGVFVDTSQPAVTNCILTGGSYGMRRSGGAAVVSFTNAFGNSTGNYSGMPDPTGVSGNRSQEPGFAAPAAGNYRLTAGSPLRGVGTNAPALGAYDLDGTARVKPLGGVVDLGAYETGAIPPYTAVDAAKALNIAAGIVAAVEADVQGYNIAVSGASSGVVDMNDAAAIARKAFLTDPNP